MLFLYSITCVYMVCVCPLFPVNDSCSTSTACYVHCDHNESEFPCKVHFLLFKHEMFSLILFAENEQMENFLSISTIMCAIEFVFCLSELVFNDKYYSVAYTLYQLGRLL